MASSKAKTVEAYLDELPDDRRGDIEAVREVVNANLRPGYVEVMDRGMIAWEIPLTIYPDTYNKRPMMMAALVSQKNYISLHLVGVYAVPELLELLLSGGKKLKMGKGCINFKSVDELPLEQIGEILRRISVESYINVVETSQANRKAKS